MHPVRLLVSTSLAALVALAACADDETTTSTSSSSTSNASTSSTPSSATTSTSSTGGSGGASGSVAEFCDAVVDPFCEALFACCTDPAELESFGGTVEACQMEFGADCATDLEEGLGPLLSAGVTTLDSTRLAACVSTLEGLVSGACTQSPQFALYLCLTAFEGTVPAGRPCSAANDISFVECDEGFCVDGTCEAFLASNAPCTPGNDPPEFCNVTENEWCLSSTSTCGPRLEAGQPCTPSTSGYDYECLSLQCESGECQLPDADTLCAEGT